MKAGLIEGVKTSIIEALRAGIDADLSPTDPLTKVIDNIDMEYPVKEESYPGIWVQFSYRDLKPQSLNRDTFINPESRAYRLWSFAGTVTLTLVGLTSLERDRISDSLIKMFAFNELHSSENHFWESLRQQQYLHMSINRDQFRPGGQTTTIGTPWNDMQLVYEDSYSFELQGEFASDIVTQEFVVLEEIIVAPTIGEWQ